MNWHFDNFEFVITLLLQSPKAGGKFDYDKNLQCTEQNDMNYAGVEAALDEKTKPPHLKV